MADIIARLIEARPDRAPRVHPLGVGIHRIGRGGLLADVVIDHPDVSRVHAELWVTPRGVSIRDLDSKNGIVLGGHRVASAALGDGDELRLGAVRICVEHPGAQIDALLRQAGEITARRPRAGADAIDPAPSRWRLVVGALLIVLGLAALLLPR